MCYHIVLKTVDPRYKVSLGLVPSEDLKENICTIDKYGQGERDGIMFMQKAFMPEALRFQVQFPASPRVLIEQLKARMFQDIREEIGD